MLIKYINDEGAANLKQFKYNGVCDSILYKYVLSGFAQSIVDIMPMWIAPNLITVTGFVFLLSAVLLHMIINPHFDQLLPSWLCYYTALCIFLYQTLDNCDGKQARRTGSSSALGCLLDHGTDCLVTWLIGIMIVSFMSLGEGTFAFSAWFVVANLSFFFAIYQQIHTGQFRLGKINGVDEGLPFVQLMFIITGYFGAQIWNIPIYGVEVKFVFGTAVILQGFNEIIQFSILPVQALKYKPIPIIKSLKLPLTYTVTFLSVLYFGQDILKGNQLTIMCIMGFQWSKMIVLLQVSNLTKQVMNFSHLLQRFSQWHFSWWAVQAALIFALVSDLVPTEKKQSILQGILIYSLVTYAQSVFSFIYQISDILQIRVFKINQSIKKML